MGLGWLSDEEITEQAERQRVRQNMPRPDGGSIAVPVITVILIALVLTALALAVTGPAP